MCVIQRFWALNLTSDLAHYCHTTLLVIAIFPITNTFVWGASNIIWNISVFKEITCVRCQKKGTED
jgi:hypothetical protein